MSRRVEHLAVIQAEVVELARFAEVGKELCMQEAAQAAALPFLTGQMLLGGQQRLEKIL